MFCFSISARRFLQTFSSTSHRAAISTLGICAADLMWLNPRPCTPHTATRMRSLAPRTPRGEEMASPLLAPARLSAPFTPVPRNSLRVKSDPLLIRPPLCVAQCGGAANNASRRGWACPALVSHHGQTTRAGQAQPLRNALRNPAYALGICAFCEVRAADPKSGGPRYPPVHTAP